VSVCGCSCFFLLLLCISGNDKKSINERGKEKERGKHHGGKLKRVILCEVGTFIPLSWLERVVRVVAINADYA